MPRARRGRSTQNATNTNTNTARRSLIHKGEEGLQRAERVRAEQAAKREKNSQSGGLVLRFFVKPGQSKEIIIVDDKPTTFMYEHNLKIDGKWGHTVPCINEWETCPACEHVSPSYYGMYLTIIDLTEFTDRKGVTHEFSRKLMVVKPSQQKKFIRDYERHGTLRGALYECNRDTNKDAAIGNDIEFIETVPEEEMMEGYVTEWSDKDGNKHTQNIGERPFNYEEILGPAPTADELAALVGAPPVSGSAQSNRQELDEGNDDDGWDGEESSTPWTDDDKGPEPEPRTRRGRRGRAGAKTEESGTEPTTRRRGGARVRRGSGS